MTNDKDIEKSKKDSQKTQLEPFSATDMILPKLEMLAQKIENLEKIENDRNSKDSTKQKK